MTALITIPQAAALVGVDKATAYRHIVKGDDGSETLYGIPVVDSAGHKRISAIAVERLIAGAA